MDSHFSVVILAAGLSGRMGTDKSLLSYGNGLCFAEHIINCYGVYGCNPVVFVINETSDTAQLKNCDFRPVINYQLNWGRSYSIHLGLQSIPKGKSCFIHNIDNPFIERSLLDSLRAAIHSESFAVPVFEGKSGHPVLLGKSVAEHIRKPSYLMDFREELKGFSRIEVPFPDKNILWNINTPEDYARFREETKLYSKNT